MHTPLPRRRTHAPLAGALVVLAVTGLVACGGGHPTTDGGVPDASSGGGGGGTGGSDGGSDGGTDGGTVAGASCAAYDSSGNPVPGCYPVSCSDGFREPSCTTDANCGPGARCVRFHYLTSKGTGTTGRCMKTCTTDADCGRPGLLACDVAYHVCTDFEGEFLSSVGTLGGHAPGGGPCSTATPPARSNLFSANVAASNPKDTQAAEVSLAIDPTTTPPTLYAAYNSDLGSEISRSDDGGATWTALAIPDPKNIGDPALAVDPQSGELYYAYIGGYGACLAQNAFLSGNEIHLVWSTDHGKTFHGPVVVNTGAYAASSGVFMDKPQAVVGPQGDVYVTFDAAPVAVDPVAPSDIVLARSTDHGQTFTDVRVNGTAHAVGRDLAQPAVDAAGDLWVTWMEPAVVGGIPAARAGHIRIAESTDRGQHFGASVVVDPGDQAAYWPHALTVSPDGTKVYVAYQAWTGKVDVFDVKVAWSLDGGATFQPGVKVNDDATCATHWLPGIGLGPKGDVWTVWYDNRFGDERVLGAEGTLTGQTLSFGKNFAVTDGSSGPFSTGRAYGTITDYLGFATSGSLALAGWADLRNLGPSYGARIYTSVATLPR